jgi:hypothetical protein
MNYNVIITDNKGAEVKVRLKIPYWQGLTDATNSRWHAEGGKMKFANGTCDAAYVMSGKLLTATHINLNAGSEMGVTLFDFFSGYLMGHNQGGIAIVASGWGGTTIVPGKGSWAIDD